MKENVEGLLHIPPLTPLFAELSKTASQKATARQLRQLAVEHALEHGNLPVPPFETFRTWVQRAYAAMFSLGHQPFDIEKVWVKWQHRKLSICPAGLHRMIGDNIYLRYRPKPTGGFFKYPECKACKREQAKYYRERRGPARLPPKAQSLSAEDEAAYVRAIARIGPEGLGNELLRWQRALGKRYGRARLRPRLRFAKE